MKLVDDHLPGAASSSSGPKNGTQPSTQVTPEARVVLGDVAYRVMVTYGCTAIVIHNQYIHIYIYVHIYIHMIVVGLIFRDYIPTGRGFHGYNIRFRNKDKRCVGEKTTSSVAPPSTRMLISIFEVSLQKIDPCAVRRQRKKPKRKGSQGRKQS